MVEAQDNITFRNACIKEVDTEPVSTPAQLRVADLTIGKAQRHAGRVILDRSVKRLGKIPVVSHARAPS